MVAFCGSVESVCPFSGDAQLLSKASASSIAAAIDLRLCILSPPETIFLFILIIKIELGVIQQEMCVLSSKT
jgi:hypothetical protein